MTNKVLKVKFRTPEEVYKIWIKALRSGKYQQGFGELKNRSNEFCCLGVLCDLAAKDGGEQWNKFGPRFVYSDFSKIPPRHILEYLELSSDNEDTLIGMNDIQKKSFKTIANYIEKNYLPKVLNK